MRPLFYFLFTKTSSLLASYKSPIKIKMNVANFLMLRIFREIYSSRVAMKKRWICVTSLLSSSNLFIYPCCILYWNLCFVIFRKSPRDFLGLLLKILIRIKLKSWIPNWNHHQQRLQTNIKITTLRYLLRVHRTWKQCLSEVEYKVKIQLKVRSSSNENETPYKV